MGLIYIVLWRHNANCPWCFVGTFDDKEQANDAVDKYGRYDMVKREYAVVPTQPLQWDLHR